MNKAKQKILEETAERIGGWSTKEETIRILSQAFDEFVASVLPEPKSLLHRSDWPNIVNEVMQVRSEGWNAYRDQIRENLKTKHEDV